jgi:hypothetical protein
MPAITVNIRGDRELTAKLERIRRANRVGEAALVWAQAVAIEDRNRARRKPGRSFWADQAKRIAAERHGPEGASVRVGREGLHHHTGGDIFPKNARALTIPISDEARGKRAREFEAGGRDLFVLPREEADPDTVGILGYSEGERFHALFVLRSKVHHDPRPWLTEEQDIRDIGRRELDRFAATIASEA